MRSNRGFLAGLWGESVTMARCLSLLAETMPAGPARARVLVLASFARAHASRLLARCAAMGRGPLPVPFLPDAPEDTLGLAARFDTLAHQFKLASHRCAPDSASQWVCEMNHTECLDAAHQLRTLASAPNAAADFSEKTQGATP